MPPAESRPPKIWQAPAANWAYWLSQAIVWTAFAPFIRKHVYGYEHVAAVARRGGYILAPNHISHFDGPILTATAPGAIDWLVDAPFFLPNGLGAWMRLSGGIPVPWPPPVVGAVRESIRRLQRWRTLGIFPDGGLRSGAESVLEGAPISRGAVWLSMRGGVPVVPCVILGTDRLYVKYNWRFWRGRVPVWIGFGPAIQSDEWANPKTGLLGDRLRSLYAQMKTTFDLHPDDLPMTAQERWGRS